MSKVLSKSGIVVLYVALFQLLLTSPAAAMPFQIEGVGGGNARLYVVHGGANVSAPFGGELGVVNLTTGSYTTIGTPVPGASLTGLAYSANQLYVSTSNHSLAILNLAGGLISETPFSGGGFDSAAGDRVTDLAASRTGNLYASTWIGGVNTLCSVEPSNAELTVIGPLPDNGGGFHSLAFLFGRLYSHQTNAPGTFDEVSLTTGASVNAIPGGVPGGALGFAGNPEDGGLYATECCAGDDGGLGERIYVVDSGSGTANLLLDFDDGRRIQDLEFVPVPNFDRGDMFVVHGGANVGAPFGGELGIIDTETGVYLSLGTPVPGAGLTGLAFSRGRFYASTSNLTLAEISLSGSLISETPFFGAGFSAADRVSDLASDSAGRIYGAARIGGVDTLVRINPATAELAAAGPLPVSSGGFKALAFVGGFANDRLFSHESNAPGQFDRIDETTGASVNTIVGGVGGGALGMGSTQGLLVASECCLLGAAAELGERIFILDPSTGNADQFLDFNDGRRIHDIEFIPQQMYVVHGGANVGAPFGGEFGIVNIFTGGYRTLSAPVPGAGLTGLAYDNGRFYMSTSNHTLAVTDMSGGLLSEMPFFGSGFDSMLGDRVNDLAIGPDGSLYAATLFSSAGTSYTLCALNPATAELNLIGSLPENGGGFQALSFAGSRLFGQQTNFTGPVFDEIDINTGASLNMIAGGVPGGALGLGYSPFFQLFFGSECCNGDDGALGERIWYFDPTGGFSFILVDYDDGRRIQDIEFVPAAPVLRGILRSVTPTRGTYVSGGIPELDFSDNLDYQMRRSTTDVQSRTEFVIRGISPSLFPVSMEVTLEGAVFARSQVDQIIELFNYDTNAWEQIDSRSASRFNDSTTTVAVPGLVSRFVDAATGAMEARIRYRSLNPRQQFSSNTDLFLWNIGL